MAGGDYNWIKSEQAAVCAYNVIEERPKLADGSKPKGFPMQARNEHLTTVFIDKQSGRIGLQDAAHPTTEPVPMPPGMAEKLAAKNEADIPAQNLSAAERAKQTSVEAGVGLMARTLGDTRPDLVEQANAAALKQFHGCLAGEIKKAKLKPHTP